MGSLIVGDGYLAAALAGQLSHSGVSVARAPRPDRPGLDRLISAHHVDQVVLTPRALGRHAEGLVDHVDGPRWVMCSWAGSSRSLDDVVLERGGTVLRLSAVFGRGGDDNVTRIARCVRRYRTLVAAGNGGLFVQPLHVDDLVSLVGLHLSRPLSGCFDIAGPEAVPVTELCRSIVEILGVRPIARVTRARAVSDWRDAHAPVDTNLARAQFGWSPLALGIRVEQAVIEAFA